MTLRLLVVVLAVAFGVLAAPARAERTDYRQVAQDILARGDATVAEYDPAQGIAASQVFSRLYFGVFESSGFEFRLGSFDRPLLTDVEARFGKLVRLTAQGAPRPEIEAVWKELRAGIAAAAEVVVAREAAESSLAVAVDAFLILAREAVAPLLALAAAITLLRRGGAGDRTWLAWGGFAVALGLGAMLTVPDAAALRGVLMGATLSAAVVILLVLGGWQFVRRGEKRDVGALLAVRPGRGWQAALAVAVALPALRAAGQALPFLAGLDGGEGGDLAWIAAGALAALGAAALLYAGLRGFSRRLSLGGVHAAASIALLAAALVLAGQGVADVEAAASAVLPMERG